VKYSVSPNLGAVLRTYGVTLEHCSPGLFMQGPTTWCRSAQRSPIPVCLDGIVVASSAARSEQRIKIWRKRLYEINGLGGSGGGPEAVRRCRVQTACIWVWGTARGSMP